MWNTTRCQLTNLLMCNFGGDMSARVSCLNDGVCMCTVAATNIPVISIYCNCSELSHRQKHSPHSPSRSQGEGLNRCRILDVLPKCQYKECGLHSLFCMAAEGWTKGCKLHLHAFTFYINIHSVIENISEKWTASNKYIWGKLDNAMSGKLDNAMSV